MADRRQIEVSIRGVRRSVTDDFYHRVLAMSWTRFFLGAAAVFAVLNSVFAAAYAVVPGAIDNAHGFVDCFFFSVQTLATIGYGVMAPKTTYGHSIVTLEAFLGIIVTAGLTGLTFARFARPTARIVFTDKAVIHARNGKPHLMFRMANQRGNQIIEAQLHVLVLLTERTAEGEMMRRPTHLKLVRDRNAMFALSWTAMHEIDEQSPFFGEDAFARLRALDANIFLSLSGLDETLMQTIHARYRYEIDDIVQNAHFADILSVDENGQRIIDFAKFHAIVPMEPK